MRIELSKEQVQFLILVMQDSLDELKKLPRTDEIRLAIMMVGSIEMSLRFPIVLSEIQ